MPIAYLPLTDLVRGAVTDINPEPSITEYDWTTEISSIVALPSGFGQGTTIYRVYHESMWITPFDDSKTPTNLALYIIKSDQSSYRMLTIPYGQWTDVEIYDYYKIIACPLSNGRGYSKPECYDENHNPISGRSYPECNGLKFDYREWRLTPNGIMIEEMPDPALPMHEPLPYSIWRLTPDERDYIFHRRLPNHLPPAPIPYTPLERENVIRVYDKSEPQDGFISNGLAVLHPCKCISLHNDDRWDIELVHPLDNWGKWKYLLVMNILKIDGQLFRIKNQKAYIDSSGMFISVKASHITCDLADEAVVDSEFSGGTASDFIIWAKTHTLQHADESDRYELPYQFNISSDSTDQLTSEKYQPSTLLGLLIGLDNCLMNKVHGELFRDNFHLSINRRMEGAKDNAFYLRYSLDMVEISQEVDYSDFCTYLYCYNNWGSFWAVSYAGTITWAVHHQVKKVVKFNYSDYEGNLERLMADGQALTEKCFYPRVTYKMKIAALKNDPKYKNFLELQNYNYGDSGTVYCPELDISTEQKIVEVEKDELTGEIISMTLGNLRYSVVRPTYMGSTISSGTSVSDKVSDSMQSVLIGSNIANMQKYSLQKLQTYPIITLQGG